MNKYVPRVLSSLASDLLGEPIRMARSTLSTLLWYKVDISGFRWQIDPRVLKKHFKHMPMAFAIESVDNEYQGPEWSKIAGTTFDVCRYDGTTILLKYAANENTTVQDGLPIRIEISLNVLYTKKNIQTLKMFTRTLVKETREIERQQAKSMYRLVGVGGGGGTTQEWGRPTRSVADVFIPDTQQRRIEESVTKFAASEKWYREHNIPYHFGIMLHGAPGTGKSSVVQAITNIIDCDVYYVNTASLGMMLTNDYWIRTSSKERTRIVIIEDVDTSVFSKRRNKPEKVEKFDSLASSNFTEFNIGTFLNFIDGFASPDKVIYIMTTNHLDELDPALIRPGRIDLSLEIGYVDNETFAKFTMFHYKRIPMDINVRNGLTFAELQTKVMEGMTFEDLCDYVKIKEEEYHGK